MPKGLVLPTLIHAQIEPFERMASFKEMFIVLAHLDQVSPTDA